MEIYAGDGHHIYTGDLPSLRFIMMCFLSSPHAPFVEIRKVTRCVYLEEEMRDDNVYLEEEMRDDNFINSQPGDSLAALRRYYSARELRDMTFVALLSLLALLSIGTGSQSPCDFSTTRCLYGMRDGVFSSCKAGDQDRLYVAVFCWLMAPPIYYAVYRLRG